MTSADELFRSYAAAFEANEDPSAAEYLGRLKGADRYALELMIDSYLTNDAPSRPVDRELFDISSKTAWARKAREVMAEPSPSDVRLAREEQDMSLDEVAVKVLAGAGVESPTPEETSKAAGYIGRLEAGELARVGSRVWSALCDALGVALSPPKASPEYGMAFRMSPQSPGTVGMESLDEESFPEAEAILHAYSIPSPKSWDRVDELFLGE